MKLRKIFLLLLPIIFLNAQQVGKLAPEKPPEEFPPNSWGVDLMFGEGGFGLGTFLRHSFDTKFTGFVDISFSESKDEREFEFIDPFGRTFTFGKENRVFLIPLNFGVQYRLFEDDLTSNLRPYLNAGIGPTLVLTTPYEEEFFRAFGRAQAKYGAGGYVGFGANFGTSKSSLIGLNLRYYYIHLFGDGVENLQDRFRTDLAHFYLTINIGIMY